MQNNDVRDYAEEQDCPACGGRGYESIGPLNLDCATCNGTGIMDADDQDGDNCAAVTVDGTRLDYDLAPGDEVEYVQVSFPDKENGYQNEAQRRGSLGWCNSAAIRLDRADDSVTVSVSCGDPRGAFTMTIRRTSDGRLLMHVPYPEDTMLHRPLRTLRDGTYEVE